MDWIKSIILYIVLLQCCYNHYNELLTTLFPRISVTLIEFPISDYLTRFPITSLISPSLVNTYQLNNFCLLLHTLNLKFIDLENNLLEIYFKSNEISDIDNSWSVFQLDLQKHYSYMQQQLFATLTYTNDSLELYSVSHPLIRSSTESVYVFFFTVVINEESKIDHQISTPMYPSCLSLNRMNNFSEFCVSLITCDHFKANVEEIENSERVYRRVRREAPSSNISNSTSNDQSTSGLSPGLLAVAIVVPILVVAALAVGGYFLYRWLQSRRSSHGIYQPNYMENEANIPKGPEPHTVVKIPQEERLI